VLLEGLIELDVVLGSDWTLKEQVSVPFIKQLSFVSKSLNASDTNIDCPFIFSSYKFPSGTLSNLLFHPPELRTAIKLRYVLDFFLPASAQLVLLYR
jgi:hypothetical protein